MMRMILVLVVLFELMAVSEGAPTRVCPVPRHQTPVIQLDIGDDGQLKWNGRTITHADFIEYTQSLVRQRAGGVPCQLERSRSECCQSGSRTDPATRFSDWNKLLVPFRLLN